MSVQDEKAEESRKKELYREKIKPYLPRYWEEYEIDDFLAKLLCGGLVPVPGSKYDKALRELSRKGLFRWIYLDDGCGKRTSTRKYFPNISIVKD